jgi:uncharacterized membrane protein
MLPKNRLNSIDALRGIIIILMALDHVREQFGNIFYSPIDLQHTSIALFLTRWITHFCAPLFMFLAGISIFLYEKNKSKKKYQLSRFLFARGLWLIFVEIVIVNWSFLAPNSSLIVLQVIWVIGLSMFLMGFIIWLPKWCIFVLALIIIFLSELIGLLPLPTSIFSHVIWVILYNPSLLSQTIASFQIRVVFTLLPGLGVMMLGYIMGICYTNMSRIVRKKAFIIIGITSIMLFFILRYFNLYGDPYHWFVQSRGSAFTFLSFVRISKYPFSLQFLLLTLGVGFISLILLEKVKENSGVRILLTYGRVPFFFYLLHLYLIAIFAIMILHYIYHLPIGVWWYWHKSPSAFKLFKDYHYSLIKVYIYWIILLLVTFPVCVWYERFKKNKRSQLFSYL